MIETIQTYKDFEKQENVSAKARKIARNLAVLAFSLNRNINKTSNWIRFPYYHHVFNDEKKDFERQMRFLKNFGEFISIDQAVELVNSNTPLDGRFFCLSFDDGFYNCYSNMMGITIELNIPVVIYLPTNFIGLDVNIEKDLETIKQFYPEKDSIVPFLSWENCKEMSNYNITFGSHTSSHANLSKLSPIEIEFELAKSKQCIEENLNIDCDHFACPWGRVNIDFYPEITTQLSEKLGYKTFATTNRGKMEKGSNLYQIKRDHVIAEWPNFQLKYFFGQ